MTNEKSLQTPLVTQKVVGKCSPCNPNSNRCYLCLYEKLKIAAYQANNLLKKKKTKLISKCRHQSKYTLSKYDVVVL